MKIANTELQDSITDNSAFDFRNDIVLQLEKCVEEPFAMNNTSLSFQTGQQQVLQEIIQYLKDII